MKKTRWRAIMKAEGYTKSQVYFNGDNYSFWTKSLEHKGSLFDEEEIRKDKNILYWLAFKECPECEYCRGSGIEDTDGWYHSCCGCEGSGVDTSNIKIIGRLEN